MVNKNSSHNAFSSINASNKMNNRTNIVRKIKLFYEYVRNLYYSFCTIEHRHACHASDTSTLNTTRSLWVLINIVKSKLYNAEKNGGKHRCVNR